MTMNANADKIFFQGHTRAWRFVLFLRQAADIGERMCQCTISDGYLERKFKIGDHDIVELDF